MSDKPIFYVILARIKSAEKWVLYGREIHTRREYAYHRVQVLSEMNAFLEYTVGAVQVDE